jgi:CheY-like chemotaxis protein
MTKFRGNSFKDKSGIAVVLTDLTSQERLQRILQPEGYEVHSFTVVSKLMEFLETWTPDVVLVDVRFAGGDYKKVRKVITDIRKWKIRQCNSPFPVVVCVAALWNPVEEEELRRQGADIAWLSDRDEILHRMQYGLYIAHSTTRNIPYFRILLQNPDGSSEITEQSILWRVVLVDERGNEYPVPLSRTPLLIFTYLLLRRGSFRDVEEICSDLNLLEFYSSQKRIFSYDAIKTELSRIRKCMKAFLRKHHFSFAKIWVEESLDGDERTTGITTNARVEIDVEQNETAQVRGSKR